MRFVGTSAWRCQSLQSNNIPVGLAEADYVAPSPGLSSHDQRKNWTDFQETAQWLGGKVTVVYHSTSYDGCWEKAAVKLGCGVCAATADLGAHKLANKMVRSYLLNEWKSGSGLISGQKFVETASNMPDEIMTPEFLLCKMQGEQLVLPSDIRQKWLADPLRSKEWKKILSVFDRQHGVQSSSAAAAQPVPATPAAAPEGQAAAGEDAVPVTEGSEAAAVPGGPWATIFADEPKTVEALTQKYDVAATFATNGSSGLVLKVVEGPKLFLCAPLAGSLSWDENALVTHGAGQWLLDAKAAKLIEDCG
eukprot:s1179_g5.t1